MMHSFPSFKYNHIFKAVVILECIIEKCEERIFHVVEKMNQSLLAIPDGLVYGNHTPNNHLTNYHLVLEGNHPLVNFDSYQEDMLSVDYDGQLCIIDSAISRSVKSFVKALQEEKIFLLSDYFFNNFLEFYRASNFHKSKLYVWYPEDKKIIQKTPQLEQLSTPLEINE